MNDDPRRYTHILMEATVLNPGDKVLIATQQELSPDEGAEVRRCLTEFHPDVEFLILANVQMMKMQEQ